MTYKHSDPLDIWPTVPENEQAVTLLDNDPQVTVYLQVDAKAARSAVHEFCDAFGIQQPADVKRAYSALTGLVALIYGGVDQAPRQ